MHGEREGVYIRKGWSVNARREGRCVHMCASSVCAWREDEGVECACMGRARMVYMSVSACGRGCVYMEGVECVCMWEREDVCI